MKIRKFLVGLLLCLTAGISAFAFAGCEEDTPSGNNNPPAGTESTGGGENNGEESQTAQITVTYDANGGAFEGGGATFTQTVNGNTTLTAPTSPKRTNYTFAGWATDKNGGTMWTFDTDKPTGNVTLYAIWKQQSGKILSVDNATMDGEEVFMLVDHTTDIVSLSSKVVCSDDSTWKLYYDRLGQTEIPTKIAAGALGELDDGDNIFYMVVTSQDGTQVNVYELNVYRSFAVDVKFYDGTELLKTETAYTGYEYTTSYTPNITGYTFNDWDYTPRVIWEGLSLYADTTANTYTVTYDVNGGDALSTTEKTVTYDSSYTLAKPTRTGYMFLGWYLSSTQMTNANGGSLEAWGYTSNKTLTAKWQANDYAVILNRNVTSAGTVTGAGDHAYDSNVTITASTNSGYTWLGWYDKDGTLVTTDYSYTFKMGFAVTYTAKWSKTTITRNNTSAGSVTSLTGKYKPNDEVTVTASTKAGYTFVGWYNGETKLTDELSYTFTMSAENVTYTAKWCKVTLSVSDTSAGSVSELSGKYVFGEETTVTATTNDGYTWLGWYNGETKLTDELSYTFTMPEENVTCTAKWNANTDTAYKVEYYLEDLQGQYVLDNAKTENKTGTTNTTASVTAKTITGFTYYKNKSTTSGNIHGDGSLTLKLYYSRNSYTVSTGRNNTSAGSVSGGGTYDYQKQVTVTATTYTGYTFVGWYNGETKLTDELSYTFTMPAESVTYTAKWCKITLSRSDTSAGSISSLSGKYVLGDEVTITATTNDGYTWLGWYDGETKLTDELSYTFTMPAENVTYTAKWIECPVTLEQNIADAGNVSGVSGATQVGKETTITATTNDGYTFVGWYNGETKLTDELSYAFTMSEENIMYTAKWEVAEEMQNFNFTSTATTCSITGIKDKTVTSIIVPDYVTSISGGAFSGCSSLESITIPFVGGSKKTASDTYQYPFGYIFGTSSYTGGTATKQYYYRSDTSSRTYNTYYIPTSLKSVTVTGGNILYGAFYNCDSLTSITIPDSVTSIGSYAFNGCSSLTSVTIPDSVTSIGSDAFYNCNSLTSVTIPDGVTSIGSSAFSYCRSLTSVTIPDGVTSIGNSAFSNCSSLTSITIPDSVTSIGSSAFYNCSSLTSITIPDSVTSIGSSAFYNCRNLTSVTIPDSVTSIGSDAFYGCSKLVEVYNKSSLEITVGISSYGYVGYYAKAVYTEPYTSKLTTDSDGYMIYTDGEDKILVGYTGTATDLTLPSGITEIYKYAFYNCRNLTSVTIPDGVTSIGSYAFEYCSSLTSVTIPDGVTSIGNSAFEYCSSLTSVTIPDGVTSIGAYAFGGCDSLTSVTIPDSVTSIGSKAFYNCDSLNYKVKDDLKYLGNEDNLYIYLAGTSSTDITKATINESCKFIGSDAFYGCSSLTSVTIPDSVTSIGSYAFYGCSSLTSVTIPDSVTSIGSYAFWYCSSLTSITIPDSVKSVGDAPFFGCKDSLGIYVEGSTDGWDSEWNSKGAGSYYSYTEI